MKDVIESFKTSTNKYKITKTGILFTRVLAIPANQENKRNRIYTPNATTFGTMYFNRETERNPYLKFMLDGHHENPEGVFSLIVGSVQKCYLEDEDVYVDFLIYKGSSIYDMVLSIVKDKGSIPISLNGLADGYIVDRDELEEMSEIELQQGNGEEIDVLRLTDRVEVIDKLFLFGFDIVHQSSFDDTYFQVSENAIQPIVKRCLGQYCPVEESFDIADVTKKANEFKGEQSSLTSEELITLSIYYIEQDLDLLFEVCDTDHVMESLRNSISYFTSIGDEIMIYRSILKQIELLSNDYNISFEIINRTYNRILFYALFKRYRFSNNNLYRDWNAKVDFNLIDSIYKMMLTTNKG